MILVFNSGSSSLKFALFDAEFNSAAEGQIDWASGDRRQAKRTLAVRGKAFPEKMLSATTDEAAARAAFECVEPFCDQPIRGIGHRVVHGGLEFRETVRIGAAVRKRIGQLSKLAPLHNPPALRTIEAAAKCLPKVPQAAVFDTAFYRDLPEAATIYAVPYEWHRKYKIHRFGFHGLSHDYCARRAAEFLGRPSRGFRVVVCHLGGGCSATAVLSGKPVASTMGFSPLEGLTMGTRCGSIDPGLLLHLQRDCGVSLQEIDDALNYRSGLLGISGLSPNHAELERAARQGNPRAKLALALFHGQVRSAIASLTACLGGLDAIVFTERIGEHSPAMRAEVCGGLSFMGARLDTACNKKAKADTDIATKESPVRVLVLHTREELMVARETARVAGD